MEEHRRKKSMIESLERSENVPSRPLTSAAMGGSAAPNGGGGIGPPARPDARRLGSRAPTRHAPSAEAQRSLEKSKYESSLPYKSPKGDRFS